ncbi:MAG: hypothetical protein HRS50_00290 [Mycoplasmataceae bacterium]|nr:hypothetical protein [Mycoplasmataceae bacterium]
MNTLLINIAINFVLLIPLIVVYGIQEKNNRIKHIIVTFSGPDGLTRQIPVKIGFSWTIFFFQQWALLFRGQFIEFLILFFVGSTLLTLSILSLGGFNIDSTTPPPFEELAKNANAWEWMGYITFLLSYTALSYYYILFGNKMRLRSLYKKGYSFDNGQNENVEDIYNYIGEKSKMKDSELKPGQKQGKTHTYVVPDFNSLDKDEDMYDYSNLTLHDIRLRLKSDGIPFSSEDTREELMELIEKFIIIPEKQKEKEKKEIIEKSKYAKKTIEELVEELDKEKISYKNTMNKKQLIELLEENKSK